ncbi:STAS domain-containing protein [Agaribacterium sp. ZY112]|uniref:STAS domain-containing protein n=1 Tax=Agaribacterium sp. ZY112 TaxID=3233574 RepID=UPI0035233199
MNICILKPETSAQRYVHIKLSGEFDAGGCKEIRKELEQLVSDHVGKELELDLSQVSFIDSSGIGAIVFLYKRMLENNGGVKLKNVHGQPKELITLLRVDKAIHVEWAQNLGNSQMEAQS